MSIPSIRRDDMSIYRLGIDIYPARVDRVDTKRHAQPARRLVHVHRSILTRDKGESLSEIASPPRFKTPKPDTLPKGGTSNLSAKSSIASGAELRRPPSRSIGKAALTTGQHQKIYLRTLRQAKSKKLKNAQRIYPRRRRPRLVRGAGYTTGHEIGYGPHIASNGRRLGGA